jgi:hypothetical protein
LAHSLEYGGGSNGRLATVAKFNVGDRVAYYENPDHCGTVVAILEESPAGALLSVRWDYGLEGKIPDEALVPCPRLDIG